ncbi:neuropeptide FF receptor 1-like [Gigantopelta aegis]|uniref:neuropeptide FF receptor 1-like n=1 Tax=Gigantopelta aegis TaxID=1735272 RepID=UPI001B88C455|nr:neuropeptide FF receptor 1-like [Gigantopelta aegis]
MEMCNSTRIPLRMPKNPVQEIIGMLSFFSVLGTIGNSLVLYVYTKKRHKLASTVFIIALAASDFWTCVCVMPYTMVYEKLVYELRNDILCKLYLFLITCNVPFSAFIMVAIAVDRFLCICNPHTYSLDARRAKIIIVFLALFATVFGIITALSAGVYQLERKNLPVTSMNSTQVTDAGQSDLLSEMCVGGEANCTAIATPRVDNCTTVQAVIYTGICLPNELIFTNQFRQLYQKIYAGMFLVCFLVVFVLYILIYKFVLERRAKRDKQRRKTKSSLCRETSFTEVPLSPAADGESHGNATNNSRKVAMDKNNCIREKSWVANIRTALMLFVVTVVFVIAFLPSWLMAHRVVDFLPLVFYTYFAYNVSNPIIYAFLNPAFRKELEDVFRCRKCCRNN